MRDNSQDDKNITPDWDDIGMDWLEELKADLNMDTTSSQSSKQGATPRTPEKTARTAPERSPSQRPAASASRPSTPERSRGSRNASGSNRRAADYEASRRTSSAPPRKKVEPGEPAYRPSRRRRKTNAPLIAVIVLLVLGMGFAAYQLGSIFLNYHRDRSAYNDLASMAISSLAEAEEEGSDVVTETPEPGQETVVSEVPISVDWDYLESINSDVVGWLYCPDTVINYPVVQTNDHQFYLTHGFDGESNTSGTLFADMNSVEGIVQSNYIIYGHNMKDDSMFGSFQEYSSQSYFEQHPTLYYLTPYGNYRIDLFCAHIVEATDDNYPGYFSSTADYQSYLNKVTSSAFWVNYDVISTDYQLLTMSTCTSAAGYSDPRLLVQGMMVPIQ
jgi:sortase B